MTKIRPCKKACGYPAVKGRQFCKWHLLMRSSSDVQAEAAKARLEAVRLAGFPDVPRRSPKEWPDGERWCAGCQSFVPLFYCSGSRCKACVSAASHAKRIEDNYGITPARYKEIFAAQGGRCAICRNVPRTIRFAVDHDHKTGEVRGILCKRCNHDLLGGGHDSIDTLWNAVVYLIHPPALRAKGWEPPVELTLDTLRHRLAQRGAQAVRNAPRPADRLDPPF